MEIIEKYPDKPWSWYNISYRRDTTMEIIEKYPDKPWDWSVLSSNPSVLISTEEKIYIVKKYRAANRIKREFKRCITDPNHIFCKQRLLREFANIREI